jgi:DNA-binding HxlR family transcriptional regulator
VLAARPEWCRVTIHNRNFGCMARSSAEEVAQALRVICGRWKVLILFHLDGGKVLRFSDLARTIPEASQKMLAQQLRQLEADGILERTVHDQLRPKVEYRLTGWGQSLFPVLDALSNWAAVRTRK